MRLRCGFGEKAEVSETKKKHPMGASFFAWGGFRALGREHGFSVTFFAKRK